MLHSKEGVKAASQVPTGIQVFCFISCEGMRHFSSKWHWVAIQMTLKWEDFI